MFKNGMRPVHPGEVLLEDFLKPLGMSANALAKALRVPAPRINDVVRGRRGVSADTAMRLARYFGGDARSWLNLQTAHDLRVAEIRPRRSYFNSLVIASAAFPATTQLADPATTASSSNQRNPKSSMHSGKSGLMMT
jgi:antitoxin HigA-1